MDTIEELRHWAAFQEKPARQPRPAAALATLCDRPATGRAGDHTGAIARSAIGRNDPCTCGSGKKFKRCCGARK